MKPEVNAAIRVSSMLIAAGPALCCGLAALLAALLAVPVGLEPDADGMSVAARTRYCTSWTVIAT